MNSISRIENIKDLEEKARRIRLDTAKMAHAVGPDRKAHPGPSLSTADILVALFYQVMKLNPKNPDWADRDRFILSKGHGCLSYYAVLADLGYFPKDKLITVRRLDSILQGHPDMRKTPGVDMTAGSLGNGLGAGIGMALAAKLNNKDWQTYVLIGDGELDEGIVWESAECAAKFNLDNLTAIIDKNNFQSCGTTDQIMPLMDIASKWQAFGWLTRQIDGHDFAQIISALRWAKQKQQKPKVIIAETIKGKGISFMENDNTWHQQALTDEQLKIAEEQL